VLEVGYDDGINVWINGRHVARSPNVSSDELPYTATADSARENRNFVRFTPPNPNGYLDYGTNIIAVQVLNTSLSNSSDCFIDVRLIGETPDPCDPCSPTVYRTTPSKYEIDAVWESTEITDFNSTIRIRPNALNMSRTYRIRCRMKDNTGRWSHWSDPGQFAAGEPAP
jgi:hypothetical protein